MQIFHTEMSLISQDNDHAEKNVFPNEGLYKKACFETSPFIALAILKSACSGNKQLHEN